MHELGIANAIIEAVRTEAEKRPGSRIMKVGVRIGEMAGVDPDALSFGFEALVTGTDLEPLSLAIESRPRRHRCAQCDKTFDVVEYRVECPACGSFNTVCISGDELQLTYLEVEEA
jgi:hydrogenase nickel incorporation protein HypA/HybF